MPPKRAAKRANSPDGEEAAKRPAVKKSKSSTDVSSSTAYPWTNKGIPDSVSFPRAGDNNIRISAWNVCGLTACWKKVGTSSVLGLINYLSEIILQGFAKYIEAEDADILILTETKVY